MMKWIPLTIILLVSTFLARSQDSYLIESNSFKYDPAELNVLVGDTVRFNVSSMHPTVEVEEATYNSNGTTPLAGGFNFPSGSGTLVFDTPGTHYFVCQNHVTSGMKGKITVSGNATNLDESKLKKFTLYPTRVDQVARLTFSLQQASSVKSTVYNLLGSRQQVVLDGYFRPGEYQEVFYLGNLKPGIYILSVDAPGTTQSFKFIKE